MDFDLLTDPETLEKEKKADLINSNHTPGNTLPMIFANFLVQVCGFLLYGTVIMSVHWAILPLIALTDAALAEDLRLYSMLGWLRDAKAGLLRECRARRGAVASKHFQAALAGAAPILLRDGAAYALLVYLLLRGEVSLGDFTLMFAAIGAFSGWVQGIIEQAGELHRASVQIRDYRAYLDLPGRMNRGLGAPLPKAGEGIAITLENVSYSYPKSETPALENVNLTIGAGERLSVVGVNGAGKSTLVKLICGLYRPSGGAVRLNGTDISKFNRDEYYTLFSAVFQGIYELNATIAGNVSQSALAATDRARDRKCLELSGLLGKAESLPRGMDTMLLREIESDSIELSGGEKQKLALARALYKDAPVIVLDEPTAALDPIAESGIYSMFDSIVGERTAIYISHRLSSCRFCDDIAVFDGGRLVQRGGHGELPAGEGGKYRELWTAQAQYYE
jgi:ATP-binding cassette subfamily B protein